MYMRYFSTNKNMMPFVAYLWRINVWLLEELLCKSSFSVWISACMGCANQWVSVPVGLDEYALCQSFPWKTRWELVSSMLFLGQHKMVAGFRPRSLFPYQIVYIELLAKWTYILKIARKWTEQRVEIGTVWKRTYVIEVPGAPVLWVIIASLLNVWEIHID